MSTIGNLYEKFTIRQIRKGSCQNLKVVEVMNELQKSNVPGVFNEKYVIVPSVDFINMMLAKAPQLSPNDGLVLVNIAQNYCKNFPLTMLVNE